MDWFNAVLTGGLTFLSVANILISAYTLKKTHNFKSSAAKKVKRKHITFLVIFSFIFITTIVRLFIDFDGLKDFEPWTIAIACVCFCLGLLAFFTQKETLLKDLEESDHLLQNEIAYKTKDMTNEEKEQFKENFYNNLDDAWKF